MSRISTFNEFAQTHNAVTTYAAATAALGGETSDIMKTAFYQITNYDKIVGICVANTVVATHTITLKMYQGTDTDGASSATISGASTTYLSSQVTDAVSFTIEVDAEQLTDGYDYVAIEASTDDADGAEVVALAVFPMNPRYGQASPPA